MKKFLAEFREFASRGDVMNLAIGVIIGGAFQTIVNSLVDDVIAPIIGLVVNINFDMLILKIGNVEIKYGAFITSVINFIIIAFVIFCIIKAMNNFDRTLKKKLNIKEEVKAPTTKKCPYCMSEIDINAKKCPHCTSDL